MSTDPRLAPAAASLDALTLRSPAALVCAVPYLLGFPPSESAVALWLMSGRILLTQRIDLPAPAEDLAPWLDALWGHAAAGRADELILLIATDGTGAPRVAEAVTSRAESRGLDVRDVLRLANGRWWSLLCTDEECCPTQGRAIDPRVAAAVAAEFTLMGCAPMADRASVESSMAADPGRVADVNDALGDLRDRRQSGRSEREAWRDASIDLVEAAVLAAAARDEPVRDPAVDARILVALTDIRVRDTVLWDLAQADSTVLARALGVLVAILRAAPCGVVAPVATCAAVVAWLSGDGVRATIAVQRALDDDPSYSLAALVQASLRVGLPPDAWRDAMSTLGREECRHGSDRGARRRG
jgi:hypothetical protein